MRQFIVIYAIVLQEQGDATKFDVFAEIRVF